MKRNETVLVYAVTGLLLGILLVAVVFGSQPTQDVDPDREKTAQSQGVTPALMGAEQDDPDSKTGDEVPDGAVDPDAGGPGSTGDGSIGDGERDSPRTPATGAPTPVALNNAIVLPDKLLEDAYGTSAREGDYRVVTGWQGATLAGVLERWTGSRDALTEIQTLNESISERIAQGDQILVPWVEADTILAAKKTRDALHKQANWQKGEPYVLKKGDSLWKVASKRVATNLIPAWLERFKTLNPEIENLGALVEGQKVRLPR